MATTRIRRHTMGLVLLGGCVWAMAQTTPGPRAGPSPAGAPCTGPVPATRPAAASRPATAPALLTRDELLARIRAVPADPAKRGEKVIELLTQAGLKDARKEPLPNSPGHFNVIAGVPGEGKGVILVGAHFDTDPGSPAVIDNWTGVAMMASLAQTLSTRPGRHSFEFVGFDLEERGAVGSRQYVSQLTADRKAAIVAMVNLECLGISKAKVWLTGSADALEALADQVAWRTSSPVDLRQLRGVSSDSDSFMRAGIAAITFDSLEPADFDLMGSPADKPEAIRADNYQEQYRYLVEFLQALDATDGPISPDNKDRPPMPALPPARGR